MRMRSLCVSLFVLVALVSLTACASARHVAVTVDATVAQAVFAVDDAEYQAWKGGAISDATHQSLNPIIKKALEDVKTVTVALQATPKGQPVPTSLPQLLEALRSVQSLVASLPASDVTKAIGSKVGVALDAVITLLSKLAGA